MANQQTAAKQTKTPKVRALTAYACIRTQAQSHECLPGYLQEQKASDFLYPFLEQLVEWLKQQEGLFPSEFGKNYVDRVLNSSARANISQVLS